MLAHSYSVSASYCIHCKIWRNISLLHYCNDACAAVRSCKRTWKVTKTVKVFEKRISVDKKGKKTVTRTAASYAAVSFYRLSKRIFLNRGKKKCLNIRNSNVKYVYTLSSCALRLQIWSLVTTQPGRCVYIAVRIQISPLFVVLSSSALAYFVF